jgi:hypothetical protein
MSDQYKTQRDAEMRAAQDTKSQQTNDINSLINDLAGKSQQKSDLYATADSSGKSVNDLKKETDALSSQIDAIDLAGRRKIEQITNSNPNGMVGAGAQGEIDRINRETAAQKADVAIVLAAKTKQYDTAKSIVDRQVDAETEGMKTKLESLKFFYSENKDSLTREEDRKYQEKITADTRAYNEAVDLRKQIGDIKIAAAQNGAPASVLNSIGNATDLTGALSAAGKYNVDQLRQLQIEKAKVDLTNAQNSSGPTPVVADYTSFLQSRTPEQILKFNSLPAEDKSVVAQLVNGDALITDLVKSRGEQGTKAIQKYVNEAQSIDPNFSINNNKVRYNFMQGWNNPNGKASVTRNALNTALGHLADFKMNADVIDSGTLKKLNSVKNILSTETGDPNVLRLRTDINALATEVATAYKGGQPTEAEIRNWEETIAADFSKAQFKGVTDELTRLLSSKITASRYQFKSTMGYEYGQTIIDPEKKSALLNVGVSPDVFPEENTGNPNDNAFGQTISTNPIYDSTTGQFNIPTN